MILYLHMISYNISYKLVPNIALQYSAMQVGHEEVALGSTSVGAEYGIVLYASSPTRADEQDRSSEKNF